MPRSLRTVPVLALPALVALLGPAVDARAATLQPLVDAAPVAVPSGFDRVLRTPSAPAIGPRAASGSTHTYRTSDGTPIPVTVSTSYSSTASVARSYVRFLGSLPHGSELSRLRVTVATPTEVQRACGGGAGVLACYIATTRRMIVPGESGSSGSGITTSYVVAHEYGHHVAAFRSNRPWPALDYGPKLWASQRQVCAGVLAERLVPGDEGSAYALNPGEAWAETYAHLRYPRVAWRYTDLLRPTAGALAAARRDVLRPWRTERLRRFSGTLSATSTSATHRVRLTLDGVLRVRLTGPADADYDLALSSNGRQQASTSTPGAADAIVYPAACRDGAAETLTVTVTRRRGAGPYGLAVRYAG